MDILLLTLRWIHIVGGSLWVGFAVFAAFLLGPAIQDAGPGAAGIMPALARRGIMTILPGLALATVLSGLALYWKVSGGALAAFLQTGTGLTLALSALASVVAWFLGILVARPAMLGAAKLMQSLADASAEERTQRLASAARLRARGAKAGQYGGVLLLLAATGMAVARYL